MNINDQLEHFLADLGVEMEQPQEQYETTLPEISIFQASRQHYGVFYRLDIIDSQPELRVMVPDDYGTIKMVMYLVTLNPRSALNTGFATMAANHGSPAYEKGRDAAMQHMLYAIAEMMKQLFWSGDLDKMNFPPEIKVSRLL